MVTFRVLLFAGLSEVCGHSSLSIELAEGGTVADLVAAAELQYPALSQQTYRVAVNAHYQSKEAVLPQAAEIAFIPPVSGG